MQVDSKVAKVRQGRLRGRRVRAAAVEDLITRVPSGGPRASALCLPWACSASPWMRRVNGVGPARFGLGASALGCLRWLFIVATDGVCRCCLRTTGSGAVV